MGSKKGFIIGKTKVGGDNPCFIVAEIGINFDGKLNQAIALIDSAVNAGCNAVKFQLFTAERMYAQNAGEYKTPKGEKKDIINIIKRGELPTEWIPKLKNYANKKGIEFFSSVLDEENADILEHYGVDAYKIPSYEITHLPLLQHIAKKKKPIIFSCGGAILEEVAEAMKVFQAEGQKEIGLLHCIGRYSVSRGSLNLKVISTLQLAFPQAVIGYSDHSSHPTIAPRAAVALGAKIIEKHITLDRNLPGPDHSFALAPSELALMVKTIRKSEKEIQEGKKVEIDPKLLGISKRKTYEEEKEIRNFAYRCIFAKKDIRKGARFTKDNIAVLRPGENERGLEPKYYQLLMKKYKAIKGIPAYKSITWDEILEI